MNEITKMKCIFTLIEMKIHFFSCVCCFWCEKRQSVVCECKAHLKIFFFSFPFLLMLYVQFMKNKIKIKLNERVKKTTTRWCKNWNEMNVGCNIKGKFVECDFLMSCCICKVNYKFFSLFSCCRSSFSSSVYWVKWGFTK